MILNVKMGIRDRTKIEEKFIKKTSDFLSFSKRDSTIYRSIWQNMSDFIELNRQVLSINKLGC